MNNDFLRGKKILFIGPVFYNYHNEIMSELKNVGASVDFYAEKPMFKLFIFNYLFLYFRNYFVKKYLNKILLSLEISYDYIFIIRGEIITEEFMKELRKRNQNAFFIMYQWDSLKNNTNYINLIKYFDKVLTFDIVDSEELNINYLPLFYINKYENINLKDERDYDIVFFGSYHGDRLSVVKKLYMETTRLGLNVKFHLYIPKMILFKRLITRQIKLNDFKFLSTFTINDDEILQYYSNTKTVLDIENFNQNGLTIRTLEVLGSGLNLITTNKNILNDEIYNREDIYFLDRNNIYLDIEFFNNLNKIKNKYTKYSIFNWIFNVFN